jgi:hypothetical protein
VIIVTTNCFASNASSRHRRDPALAQHNRQPIESGRTLENAINGAAVGGVATWVGAVASSLPTLMSITATVVPGVGSFQAAFIGPLMAFSVAPVAAPVIALGATIGGVFYYFSRNR